MKIKKALSYDDVLLVPTNTHVQSRSDASTQSFLKTNGKNSVKFSGPLIASPMSTVCGVKMCIKMAEQGCLGILHRGYPYISIDKKILAVKEIQENGIENFGVAIGCKKHDFESALQLVNHGVKILCVDVANGHNIIIAEFISALKNKLPNTHIMTGNIATPDGIKFLGDAGADSIRIGIGGGHACTTRINTGVGVPTFQSILDCAQWTIENPKYENISLIADGGCDNAGDVVKALAAGADFIMAGSLFAGTSCSPGKILWYDRDSKKTSDAPYSFHNSIKVKKYEGMASYNVQSGQGRSKDKIVPEGVSTFVEYKGETDEVVRLILGGIRSGMSYCNASTLEILRSNSIFCEITNAGLMESKPRAITNLHTHG